MKLGNYYVGCYLEGSNKPIMLSFDSEEMRDYQVQLMGEINGLEGREVYNIFDVGIHFDPDEKLV